ncbi:MAG TPA: phytanoyl-CoA dioxygenase family protein [Candidatus Acidoferrales bacterium]|nr:phytanoyl-CoA dioxygenase family protein [Candidatus Acidoferrales bacterium]
MRTIKQDGYAIIPGVLPVEQIGRLLDDLISVNAPRSRAGSRHALRHAAVRTLAENPRLTDLAREVLGRDAFPFRATLFDKSQKANWLVVWHQDTALPLRERHDHPAWGPWSVKDGVIYAHAPATALSRVLALRVHLDDSLSENGPLRVLPGTHIQGVLSDDEIHQCVARISSVECLVGKGGVVAMRPLIVHASSKSRSDVPRRVLHIEYAESQEIADGFELAIA